MTVTNAPSGRRQQRSSAPVSRLPSTRERRPALAALAVLLIAGGSVLAGWLALRETHTVRYVQMRQSVGISQKVTAGDITSVQLPSDHGELVMWSERSSILGHYAVFPLKAGYVVAKGMFGDESDPGNNEAIVAIAPDSAPTVNVGSTVIVQVLDDQNNPVATAKAVVDAVHEPTTGSGSAPVIEIRVSRDCSDDVSAVNPGSQRQITVQVISADRFAAESACAVGSSDTTPAPGTKHKHKRRAQNP
jgi:hypothetical protein